MRTDTESVAGGSTPIVGAAAAVFVASSAAPIPCNSSAAAPIASGSVITYDIGCAPD
ncbi:hypothetical protein ATCCBAA256_35460 [Mycobacterium montefiorense]|nr:hypothetical protein ATCCBAA256_35460 [Mycobacterium montefiorense]